jgi:hypothetical protein
MNSANNESIWVWRCIDVFARATDGSETLDPCESSTGEVVRQAWYAVSLNVTANYFNALTRVS